MNQELVFLYKIKNDNSAILYRVYGNNPHIVLPETIDGHPVCEIAPYCFSLSNRVDASVLYSGNTDSLFELCGSKIESVTFNSNICSIGSHAFYNCRKLEWISVSSDVQELGSDVFVNAIKLHDLYIRGKSSSPSLIRSYLRQLSWDIEIHFLDLSLFYPEYYEVYDEIGPAHIFGMNIQGEGFRLRQCIDKDIINLEEYDSVFEKLCIEESKKTLIHFALTRFMSHPEYYQNYLIEHQNDILDFPKLNLIMIEKLLMYKVLSKENLDTLIMHSDSVQDNTQLIALKKKYFPIQKEMYSFEDF